ncbi:MAG: DEAD/DEAH box helicase [Limisphaerales bacterium]
MKPEDQSKRLLGITRSKAKMFEFAVPRDHHIAPTRDPAALFPLTLAIIGDVAAGVAREGVSASFLAEAKQDLRFAACFFDAYLNGDSESPSQNYLTLLAAAAYYLCDLPGSAAVLTNRLDASVSNGECRGLDTALIWLLRGRFEARSLTEDQCYAGFLTPAVERIRAFYREGHDEAQSLDLLTELREKAYRVGSARELLLADVIFAVAKRRLEISARACLPRFTELAPEEWVSTLAKPTFLREFWPAQRLLGEQGVFKGRSAIVQMPTSAGKTRATEVLIRSAIFSKRTNLAVVVAPFRALCHEIRDSLAVAFSGEEVQVDEVSDVPQDDFELDSNTKPKVLILTPEKLLYLTRQVDDLAQQIGLLVYDEGHQFDTGIRGVTYELLLTALKAVVPAGCQVVLISAVMSNAAAINEWLNGANGSVVSGADLLPSQRSIAFASWVDTLGRLEFIAQPDSSAHTYFVPRVLESVRLTRLPRERADRHFPKRDDENSIALDLGLKLVAQGAVAVFCGRKSTVTKLCEMLSDAYRHGLSLPSPAERDGTEAAQAEIQKLSSLVRRYYGEEGAIPHCAKLGVFTHHGATPSGIRLAVEHAMKESLVRMVVCTSTLAQGVNLPIRYLIVTGVYQGAKRITVRDFQNLIGRAGRSGMHTEGSIIFSNPETFDQRATPDGRWRWSQVVELLDPSKAEECASSLLMLFDPLTNDDSSDSASLNVRAFFRAYLANEEGPQAFAHLLLQTLAARRFSRDRLVAQLEQKGQVIAALESFMMAASGEEIIELEENAAAALARGTLAYHLATEEQRADLEWLFQAIATHIQTKVPAAKQRKAYSRTLFGVRTSLAIHEWTRGKVEELASASSDENLLKAIWPILVLGISNSLFRKCTQPDSLVELTLGWIGGESPAAMLEFLTGADVRFGGGERPRRPNVDHVVELCENAVAFEGVLVVAAVIEALRLEDHEDDAAVEQLEILQKRLKYGIKEPRAVMLYELGFADRVVAAELAEVVGPRATSKSRLLRIMREEPDAIKEALADFPSYYSFVWEKVLGGG